MKSLILLIGIALMSSLFSGCMTVKSYQMMYVNDTEMMLNPQKIQQFETNFQTYREGASGANGGKVGGGCGCN